MENAGLFARLPGELRNKIYEYALISDYAMLLAPVHITCNDQTEFSFGDFNPHTEQPTLTWVCRAIREETLSIYYNGNVFLLQSQPDHRRYFAGLRLRKVELDPRMVKEVFVLTEDWPMWRDTVEKQISGTGRGYVVDLVNAGQQDPRLLGASYVKVMIK